VVQIDTGEIWEYLRPESEGEVAVLSALAERIDGELWLRGASLLVGPDAIGETGWPAWNRAHGNELQRDEALAIPRKFGVEQDDFVMCRVVMTIDEATKWVDAALNGRAAVLANEMTALTDLGPAKAPIQTAQSSTGGSASFMAHMQRPAKGFHFKPRSFTRINMPPSEWDFDGETVYGAIAQLTGLAFFFDPKHAPAGLFVGRFERRAWIQGQRPHFDEKRYEVKIGLEPDRVDPADLEVELEETMDDELLKSIRLSLEDMDLRSESIDMYRQRGKIEHTELPVKLPSIGRKVRRSLRLFHRDGHLLDLWPDYVIAETVRLGISVDGSEPTYHTIGEVVTRSSADYLSELRDMDAAVRSLREEGTVTRLYESNAEAFKHLDVLFKSIDAEILILDPFFDKWELIEGLRSGARVLTSKENLKKRTKPPEQLSSKVKVWGLQGVAPVPFHDRFALWTGGGVTFGASLQNKTSKRLFRMDRMSTDEASVLRARFDDWWSDPTFGSWPSPGAPEND
jgi:hypothetical protein